MSTKYSQIKDDLVSARNTVQRLAATANAADNFRGDYAGQPKMSESEFKKGVERAKKDFPWFFEGDPDASDYRVYLKKWAKDNHK